MNKIRLFGFYFPSLYFALAVGEFCVLFGTVVAATFVRFDGSWVEVLRVLGPLCYRALFISLILSISLAALGLYQNHAYEGFTGQELRAGVAFLMGWILLGLIYYVLPELYVGRGVSAIACIFGLAGIALIRLGFFRIVDIEKLKPVVLIYGAGRKARWVHDRLQRAVTRSGIRLLGFVNTGEPIKVSSDAPVFPLTESLYDYARRRRVDEIVVAVDDRRNMLPMNDLLQCRLSGITILDTPTFLERETGTVDLELTDPSWLVFGHGFRYGFSITGVKRSLDIAFGLILLLVSSPIVLLTALAIKLEEGTRAPILYRQTRVGERGRLFKLYKIRSMRVNAESGSGACWAKENDDRITRVGRVIRKLRVDELPQVINVLKGDMSFVGPRPERPEFTSQLEKKIRYYRERSTMKPGLTGWAQLQYPYGATDTDAQEKLRYDLFYIKNHNTILDILIILLTVEVVLFRKGAR